MTKRQITAPAAPAVALAAVKTNMRIDGDDMDSIVTGWIDGVVAQLEHDVGQCMVTQSWLVMLGAFWQAPAYCDPIQRVFGRHTAQPIELPHPAQSVTSVTYVDQVGAEQTLDPSAYRLVVSGYRSLLLPARGTTWPATWCAPADEVDPDVVKIQVVAGYGDDDTAVPANVKLYIMAKLVDKFDPITKLERETAPSPFIDRLLDACRSHQ